MILLIQSRDGVVRIEDAPKEGNYIGVYYRDGTAAIVKINYSIYAFITNKFDYSGKSYDQVMAYLWAYYLQHRSTVQMINIAEFWLRDEPGWVNTFHYL